LLSSNDAKEHDSTTCPPSQPRSSFDRLAATGTPAQARRTNLGPAGYS
jgi:hypothetical protein